MAVEHAVFGIGGDGLRDELRRLLLPVFLVSEHPEEVQRVGVRLQDLAVDFLGFIEAARLVNPDRVLKGVGVGRGCGGCGGGGGGGTARARLIPAGFLGFAGHGSSRLRAARPSPPGGRGRGILRNTGALREIPSGLGPGLPHPGARRPGVCKVPPRVFLFGGGHLGMDAFVLQAIASEVNAALAGGRFLRAVQTGPLTVRLACAGADRSDRGLLLSADPAFPRLHLTAGKMASLPEPSPFCMTLRKHLAGCRIRAVEMRGWERVVQISFERRGGSCALMAEVMGRWSNLILVEGGSGRVIEAAKLVGPERTRGRPVDRGIPYRLPPAPGKPGPDDMDEPALRALLEEGGGAGLDPRGAARLLVRGVAGISPAAAEEIAARVPEAERWEGLWAAFSGVVREYREGRFDPAIILDEEGLPAGLSALSLQSAGPGRIRRFSSMSEAADAFYREAVPGAGLADRKRRLFRILARRTGKTKRSLAAAEADREKSGGAEEERIKGELLLANLDRVAKKASAVRVEREGEGEEREIALDPRLSASENAQRYFRRYKKLKRGGPAGERRRGALAAELDFLDGLLFDLEEAASPEDLVSIEEIIEAAGYFPSRAVVKSKGRKRPAARPYRRFRAPEGWEIYIGKNAAGNDALTRRVGRAGDLWFHARGLPGSHVLLRLPPGAGKADPPDAALRQGACLAARHSRGREAGKLEVDWVPFQNLRRPRGARPGLVTIRGQKTLTADPAEGERLLEELEEIE